MNGIEQQAKPIQALPFLHVQGIHSVTSDFDSYCTFMKLVTFFTVNLNIFQELISLT
jgi:hypothetical protein